MDYGTLGLHIKNLLKERGISKNQICKNMNIPRSNFNRYLTKRANPLQFPSLNLDGIARFGAPSTIAKQIDCLLARLCEAE